MRPFIVLVLILMSSSGCIAPSGAFDGDGPINMNRAGIAIKGYDPVAYFTENKPVKGSPEIRSEHQGAIFLFSSQEHKSIFNKNPQKYVPAYGGFCSLGIAGGYKDTFAPYAFDIVDGKLYLNLNMNVHWFWKRNQKAFIQRADYNWPELKEAPGNGPRDGR